MKGGAGIVAGACCAVVIACAARSTPSQTPIRGDVRGQIDELSAQIDAQRVQLGLAVPGVTPLVPNAQPMAVEPEASCHPAQSETCKDSCTLADSICANATKICELAQQLAGDPWAAQKCSAGKATCDAAHGKCCGCQP